MVKLTASIHFWNESSCIKRCLDSLKAVDEVICIDGRFKGYPGNSELSDDGSREIINSFPNTRLVDAPGKTLIEKLNLNFIEAEKSNSDFNLLIAPDCYVVGDWKKFKEELEKLRNSKFDIIQIPIKFESYEQKPSSEIKLPKYSAALIKNPEGIRTHEKYHGWYFRGNKRIGGKINHTMKQITIVHDDSIRTKERQSDAISFISKVMKEETDFLEKQNYKSPINRFKRLVKRITN